MESHVSPGLLLFPGSCRTDSLGEHLNEDVRVTEPSLEGIFTDTLKPFLTCQDATSDPWDTLYL